MPQCRSERVVDNLEYKSKLPPTCFDKDLRIRKGLFLHGLYSTTNKPQGIFYFIFHFST